LHLVQFTILDLVKFHLCVTTLTHFSIFPFSLTNADTELRDDQPCISRD